MRIKNVKPGDIINPSAIADQRETESPLPKGKWKVIEVYEFHVLCINLRYPYIKRSFCLGDLVIMGLESQYVNILAKRERAMR